MNHANTELFVVEHGHRENMQNAKRKDHTVYVNVLCPQITVSLRVTSVTLACHLIVQVSP
jgi:hypothetical protein